MNIARSVHVNWYQCSALNNRKIFVNDTLNLSQYTILMHIFIPLNQSTKHSHGFRWKLSFGHKGSLGYSKANQAASLHDFFVCLFCFSLHMKNATSLPVFAFGWLFGFVCFLYCWPVFLIVACAQTTDRCIVIDFCHWPYYTSANGFNYLFQWGTV